jgi:hypothetical protein
MMSPLSDIIGIFTVQGVNNSAPSAAAPHWQRVIKRLGIAPVITTNPLTSGAVPPSAPACDCVPRRSRRCAARLSSSLQASAISSLISARLKSARSLNIFIFYQVLSERNFGAFPVYVRARTRPGDGLTGITPPFTRIATGTTTEKIQQPLALCVEPEKDKN